MVKRLGAPERRARRRRRPRREDAEAAASGVEGIGATRLLATLELELEGEQEAKDWLARLRSDQQERGRIARDGLRTLRLALSAQRAASGDATLPEPAPQRALAWRLGWGRGEQVAEARWEESLDLTSTLGGTGLLGALRPSGDVDAQSQVVAVLRGRASVAAHAEPLLRARMDLDAGRTRLAALELESALRLWPGAPQAPAAAAAELASAAAERELTVDEQGRLKEALRAAIREAGALIEPLGSVEAPS